MTECSFSRRPGCRKSIPEPLEARIVPAANLWIGAGGGDWSVATNWSDGVPTADDDVVIDEVGEMTITISSGGQVANSLTVLGDDIFQVTGGSLTLTAESSISNLVLSGGTMNAGPDLTIGFSAALSGNATLNGTVRNEGTMTIAGDPNIGGTLDNAATIESTGRLDFTGSGRLNNLVDGVFWLQNASGGSVLSGASSVPGFFNAGTLRHTQPITSTVALPYTNLEGGIIEATQGTLNFNANSKWEGGDFRIDEGAHVNFVASIVEMQGTYVGSGSGKIVFGGGTQGASDGAKVALNGSTFDFEAGMLEISGNAEIGGSFTNLGVLTFFEYPDLAATITNAGTIIHNARIDFLAGGHINNVAGGIYEIHGTPLSVADIALGAPGAFGYTNAGIFRNVQGQPVNVRLPFSNLEGGVIEATVGTLRLNSNGTWNGGHFAISPGAEVWINGGLKTWHGTFTGSGGGKLFLNDGVQGASTGGTIVAGEGGVTFNFPAGFFTFADNAVLAAGGRFTNLGDMTMLGFPDLRAALDNAGTMTIAARLQFFGDARLENLASATLDFALGGNGIAAEGGTPGIFNYGTIRHLTDVTTNLNLPFHNDENAVIEVAAGTLVVHSGGTWTGAHFVMGEDAMIYFDSGAITWTGNYTASGGGIIRLGGGIQSFSAGAAMTIGAAGARFDFGIGAFEFANNASIIGTGTLTNAGTMRITEFPDLTTTLVNEGTILAGGLLQMSGAARLENLEGATYLAAIAGGGTLINGSPSGGIFNAGRFVVAGAGTYTISTTFNNLPTGSFQVISGTLAINSSGTWEGGEFLMNGGGLLTLNAGTKTWTGDYVGSGDGIVRLGGGTQGASSGGTIIPGAAGMRLNFAQGMFEFADNARIGAGGTIFNLGYIKTTGFPDLDTTLDNAGKIVAAGNLSINGTGRLNNLVGGVIEGNLAGTILSGGSAIGVTNAGKLRITDAGVKTVSVLFNNLASGTIEVTEGTLALHSGGTWTGANFLVGPGALVTLNAGSKTWEGVFNGSGGGIVRLGGGTQGASSGGSIVIGSGGATFDIDGGGYFEFSGNPTLSGGKVINRGKFIYSGFPNLGVILQNEGRLESYGRFDFFGSAQIHNKTGAEFEMLASGSIISGAGSTPGILNEGTLIVTTPVDVTLGASLVNTGIVRASGGGILRATGSLAQLSGGTLTGGTWIVDAGSTLVLPANVTTNNAMVVLDGASTQLNAIRTNTGTLTLGRTFNSTTAFTNNGTLELAPGGVLAVTGAVTFGANSETIFQLGGTSAGSFGRMSATGAASLAGKVSLELANGYAPALGHTYQLATYGSRAGTFAEGDGFFFQQTRVFGSEFNPTNLTVTAVAPGADLAVSNVTATAPLLPGQSITVDYTVSNLATTDTFGASWTDSAYLSLDDHYDPSDLLIGRAVHHGAVEGLGSYNGSIAGTVPIAIDGNYRIIVIADSRGQTPDVDRANNDAASGTQPLIVPLLTPGIAVNGTIAEGQSVLYRVNLPDGETRSFFANFSVAGQAEVLVRQFAVPSSALNDGYAFSTTREDLTILLPASGAGEYYIEVRGRAAAGGGTPFEFTADGFTFGISELDRTTAHNVGNVTIKLEGSEFTPLTGFDLISPTGTIIPALDVTFVNSNTAYATFNLLGVSAGLYDARATQGEAVNVLNDALGVIEGGRAGELQFSLSVPRYIRPNGRPGIVTIDYFNTGDADIYAPLLLLEAEDVIFKFPGQENFKLGGVQFFAINDEGPAGVLSPGAGATFQLEWLPVSFQAHDTNDFTLMQLEDFTPIDWDDLSDSLRPLGLSDAGWNIVFGNLKARLGDTFGELTAAASETLNHLSVAGGAPTDLDAILAFETMVADGFGEISARFKEGSYGLGYDGPEGFKVMELPDGRVRIGRVDAFLTFVPDSSGGYEDAAGSGATLVGAANKWLMTRADGAEVQFDRASGRFESITYLDGTVTAAVYNAANQLIRFDLPEGKKIEFTYNAEGLVSAVDGPDTRHTEFTYVNGRRATMTDATGTTSFTYEGTAGSNSLGALASVTLPGQSARTFAYDGMGWLASASIPGFEVTFSHLGVGSFGYSLSDGTSFTTVLDAQGRPAQQYDQTGRLVSYEYDPLGSISAITGPDSTRYDLLEIRPGSVTATSPDGDSVTVVRDSAGRLLSHTDGNGNTTRYEYDSKGRPIATLYPDGSNEGITYDNAGNTASFTNRRGETTFYTVDATGTLLSVDYPTGPDESYTYNADSRVTGITAGGQTTSITYDAAGRVTHVTFAGGRSLEYTYDVAGRLDRLEDQTGWAADYSYTPEGPLDQIRDASGALLLDYTYNSVGKVIRKDFANGAVTTFTYGDTNRVTSIQHLAPGGAVLSSFSYTYDINGQIATMTTPDGVTEYGYTRDGKLSSVELPNGRLITYGYDAAGNRTAVNDAGASTAYAVNSINAYTSAGGAAFTYDAGGLPVTRTDSTGTTSYSYDEHRRVIAMNGPDGHVQFEYNVFGRIAAVTTNGDRREYLYDPTQSGVILAEYDGNGNLLSHYVPGMGLEAQITAGGEFRAFGFDASGNTAVVTGAGGSVLNSYSYLPFGEVLARAETVANPFEFVGQRGVMEVGNGESLVSLRLYNPEHGRFTSPDPRPQPGANAYAYAGNQPLTRIDFDGFDWQSTVTATGEVNSYAAVINTPFDLALEGLTQIQLARGDELIEAGNKVAAAGDLKLGSGLVKAGALEKGYASWLQATDGAKATKALSTITTGLDVAILGNTAYNYANGDASIWDLMHDGGNVAADFLGNVPGFQVLKLAPVLDLASQYVFNDYYNIKYRPKDIGEVGGERAQEMLAEADRLGLTLDDYLKLLRQQRNEEITPRDPNDIFGPVGFGAEEIPDGVEILTRFDGVVSLGTYDYQIVFENKSDATAPAQNILITHQLDSDLDLASFELGDFGFGAFDISVPAGRTFYSTRVDATATLGIFVDFTASINATGLVTWTLNSIDPETGDLPMDPFAGLLPPNVAPPEGDGYVRFRVAPKAGLPTGTDIDAQATIIFDLEQPILTPLVTATIDSAAPDAAITAFSAANTARDAFVVRWSGADEAGGSGIQNFDIFYTDNGGAPVLWQTATTDTVAVFDGEAGHTYAFFARGRDNAGNFEAFPLTPDASITVLAPTYIEVGKKRTFTDEDGDIYTVRHSGPGATKIALLDPDGDGKGAIDFIQTDGSTTASKVTVTVKKNRNGGDGIVNIGDATVNGALGAFTAKASDLVFNGFAATGAVKSISIRDALRPEELLAHPLIAMGGTDVDKTRITTRHLADGIEITTPGIIKSLTAASIGDGELNAAAIGKLTTKIGGMNADLDVAGAVGRIAVKLGTNAGQWTAANFGAITLGGSLEADITATHTASALGKTLALGKLNISGGDLLGDIQLSGGSGAISVKANKARIGGNITDSTFSASKIASITAAGNVTNSLFLAGMDLGADGVPGGTGADSDTFAAGTIGRIKIGGNAVDSVFAAGLSNPDGIFNNGDDTLLGDRTTSKIASLIVKGSDITDTYFAATLIGRPKVGGVAITLPHAQFKTV